MSDHFDQFTERLKTANEIEPHLHVPLLDFELLNAIDARKEEFMAKARATQDVEVVLPEGIVLEVMPMPNPDNIPMWLIHDIALNRWAIKVGIMPRDEALWKMMDVLTDPSPTLN